jgi:hypothetical protein
MGDRTSYLPLFSGKLHSAPILDFRYGLGIATFNFQACFQN